MSRGSRTRYTAAEFLSWDGLHPSRQGYELMTSIIKPVMTRRFLNKD